VSLGPGDLSLHDTLPTVGHLDALVPLLGERRAQCWSVWRTSSSAGKGESGGERESRAQDESGDHASRHPVNIKDGQPGTAQRT